MNGSSQHVRANCYRTFSASTYLGGDRTYCCASCASRHLSAASSKWILLDDGVDGLGLLFTSKSVEQVAAQVAEQVDLVRAAVR